MLAALLNAPKTQADWDRWSFDNRDSHDRIRAAIAAKGGPRLGDYQLDPINPQDSGGWLERHSQTHKDMDSAIGAQSSDMLDVDLTDENQLQAFIYEHWQEHQTAERALGL